MPLEAYEIFDAATDTLIKELNLIKQKLAAGGHGDAAK